VKSGLAKILTDLIVELFKAETTTTAGRINVLGMLLSVVVVTALSLTPAFEAVVRIFRPEVRLGIPIFQLFIAFWVFVLICTILVYYLDRAKQ
jgi:hypothetical protein